VTPDFSQFQAVLLDLDGTVYHEEHALPGAIALIRRLIVEGRKYACLSNSTASPLRIVERLSRMGVELDPTHVYTAAAAACDYVLQQFSPSGNAASGASSPDLSTAGATRRRPRVYNLSTESVQEMLDGLVDWVHTPGEPCDAVIVGTPTNVHATEDRQRVALQLLRKGAEMVGICADRVYPSPRGLEFGSGALCALLGYAANSTPTFCGKPNAIFFEKLCDRLAVDPAACVLVGDNLESDVHGAKRVRMKTILTLTGVTRRRDLLHVPAELQPDWVVEDLTELVDSTG